MFMGALAKSWRTLSGLILVSAILLGCQGMAFEPTGRTVPEDKWIFLSQAGDQTGTWRNQDLTLDYKYDRYQNQLSISGIIRFSGRFAYNYSLIQYFHLDVIPVDAQGKALEMIGLTTAGDLNSLYDGPVDFYKILTLPPNTAAIAFSYRGRASGNASGFGGGYLDFWEYPLY